MSIRQRILHLAVHFPLPPDMGQKIVTLDDLTYLSRLHDVTVICFLDGVLESRRAELLADLRKKLPQVTVLPPLPITVYRPGLASKVAVFARSVMAGRPFVVQKYADPGYRAAAAAALAEDGWAAVVVDHLHPACVLDLVEAWRARTGGKIIFRMHDLVVETLELYRDGLPWWSPRRLAVAWDIGVSRRFERRVVATSDVLWTVTARLLELLRADRAMKLPPVARHLPVAVKIPERPAPAKAEPGTGVVPEPAASAEVLYIGTAHYPPNALGLDWFIRECWPRILSQVPGARLHIVGRGAAALDTIGRPNIVLHDYVESLAESYRTSRAFIVPLFSGSGIRLKILEAFANQVAVVSTTCGYAGLPVEPGRQLIVADDADGFADGVAELLLNPARAQELIAAAGAYLVKEHSPAGKEAVLAELPLGHAKPA
jgi:glycosyltransferase involved in cell wall biosynthesis